MTAIDKPLAVEFERDGERYSAIVTPRKPADFDFGDAGIYPKLLPRIGEIIEGGAAAAAGFRIGDEIRSVDGRALASPATS